MASFGRKSKVAKPGAVSSKTTEEKKAAECEEGTRIQTEICPQMKDLLNPPVRQGEQSKCPAQPHPNSAAKAS